MEVHAHIRVIAAVLCCFTAMPSVHADTVEDGARTLYVNCEFDDSGLPVGAVGTIFAIPVAFVIVRTEDNFTRTIANDQLSLATGLYSLNDEIVVVSITIWSEHIRYFYFCWRIPVDVLFFG